jgi:two-component system, cell cycle response regulator CtrA
MHSLSAIRTGNLIVDPAIKAVTVGDRQLHLTGKEYAILELLSFQKGVTLTRGMILDHVYAGTDAPELKCIDVFVCLMRKKLAQATGGAHYIETVWGRGYALREPAPDAPGNDKSWRGNTAPATR